MSTTRHKSHRMMLKSMLALATSGLLLVLVIGPTLSLGADEQPAATQSQAQQQQNPQVSRSTQPSVDRQVDAPSSSSSTTQQNAAAHKPTVANEPKLVKSTRLTAQQKKASLASQQNYDKYQLKASNSNQYQSQSSAPPPTTITTDENKDKAASSSSSSSSSDKASSSSSGSSSSSSSTAAATGAASSVAHKKANQPNKAKAPFSILRKFFPSFISSAGPMAAAAAAAAVASSDKHSGNSHSRSAPSHGGLLQEGPLVRVSGKIMNLLTAKKSGLGAVPDHAPFFVRAVAKPATDRQAGTLSGLASGLLSNPLGLGLLFSAPLIPSLLLTPLAIAGLSPAMSAINNFFGDDEDTSTPASPLAALASGNSPFASILQGSGLGGSGSDSGSSDSSRTPSLAMQAMQSFLGPPPSTEKPLFNPGIFASQGIQNAAGSLGSSSSSSSSGSSSSSSSPSSSSSSSNSSPMRNFFGGGGGNSFIQTAASMISPSFAPPPSQAGGQSSLSGSSSSSSSSQDSDDDSGLMQMASNVFDKVASYMNSNDSPASSQSPLGSLVGLSNFSPFQLSSLLASTPIGAAASGGASSSSSGSGSSSAHGPTQKAGFFSTLRNVYELFSSSFLRRQEVGDTNECHQRLICELHQRAMNSKVIRRSLQANLAELVNLDKNLLDQMRITGQPQINARVDSDTKAMLSDFLKATNNFKNGRDLINCSKLYPKCSRTMLLSVANAHLVDPVNGRAIGKFSNLMKKMKFKSAQQHTSQWKLRKPAAKFTTEPAAIQSTRQIQQQAAPMDYMQVVPLATVASGNKVPQAGQLTPADSLKLVQQIAQMQQQFVQQQNGAVAPSQAQSMPAPQQYAPPQQMVQQQQSQQYRQPQQQQQQPNFNTYSNYAPYQPQPVAATYTDAVSAPVYSSTDPTYFMATQPQEFTQPQPQQPQMMQQQQQQQQQVQPNYQNTYQQYNSGPIPTVSEQQQTVSNNNDKAKVQSQLGATNTQAVAA